MRIVLLLLLTFNPANGDNPGESDTEDWLMMTQALLRHGDRAAQNDVYITEDAAAAFFRGRGELSTEGIGHATDIGKAYRRAYVKKAEFIDGRFNPKEVFFQASEVSRVLMTAGAFSSGLFEAEDEDVIAPIYFVPYKDDPLLAINFDCTLGWDDMAKLYGITDTSDMVNKVLESMRSQEWNCTEPPAAQSDTIIAEFANSRTKKQLSDKQMKCAKDPALKFMYKYIEQLGGSGTDDADARIRLQRTIGRLANETVNNFKKMKECYAYRDDYCDPYLNMTRFYFAHDVNLLALMNVFSMQKGAKSFFQGNTPAYAASLTMELWVRNNEQYVKMFVKNGAEEDFVEFPFCNFLPHDEGFARVGRYCTIEALENAKNKYIDTDEIVCNA